MVEEFISRIVEGERTELRVLLPKPSEALRMHSELFGIIGNFEMRFREHLINEMRAIFKEDRNEWHDQLEEIKLIENKSPFNTLYDKLEARRKEDFSKQLGIVYAILTLTVTRTLLKHEEFIPQIVVGIFRVISAHVFRNVSSTSIPREIPRSTWGTGFKGINQREEMHVEWDPLGLTPNTNPRIFENYDPEKEQFVSKECMVYYYEYIRDRLRERELERER